MDDFEFDQKKKNKHKKKIKYRPQIRGVMIVKKPKNFIVKKRKRDVMIVQRSKLSIQSSDLESNTSEENEDETSFLSSYKSELLGEE